MFIFFCRDPIKTTKIYSRPVVLLQCHDISSDREEGGDEASTLRRQIKSLLSKLLLNQTALTISQSVFFFFFYTVYAVLSCTGRVKKNRNVIKGAEKYQRNDPSCSLFCWNCRGGCIDEVHKKQRKTRTFTEYVFIEGYMTGFSSFDAYMSTFPLDS